jgi:hypothetical protein
MNKCEENKKISYDTWDFIEYVPDVGEESITDYLVWQWRKLNNKFNFLNVKKHTRQFENSISGADFELELWILSRKQSLSFVFQAKKLLKNYNGYTNKLNYQNGANRQVDVLINYARSVRKIPFYILYAQPNNSTRTICPLNEIEKTALFMTDAFTIDKLTVNFQNRRLSKDRILQETNPFHCLFCCPITRDSLTEYLKRYFPTLTQQEMLYETNEIPNYVEMIASNEIQNIEEFILQNELTRFRNIGVLDLRKE